VVAAFALTQFISLGSASQSEVAYWCHVAGMLSGAVLLLLLRPAGVRLFECLRGDRIRVGSDEPMPDASRLPGAPRRRVRH
jgi:hypothetical protein